MEIYGIHIPHNTIKFYSNMVEENMKKKKQRKLVRKRTPHLGQGDWKMIHLNGEEK